jgi:4-amino-4-deoxy-L-arabinose transferase-like glycosyltransferase
MKKIHIVIIIAGTIFILLGAFHSNIWFDEAYTVGIVNRNFAEIWKITGSDVHPPLYYWLLKIATLGTNNIMAYRLFSAVAIVLTAILGYTHIRKDFGEKTGLMFSFLSLFLPCMAAYAIEIRMYSWSMLFVTITAIYAYRLTKTNTLKNWIIFAVFSLAGAYTHYYGLMFAGIINLIMLIFILKNKKSEYIKPFVISAIAQIMLYIPWLVYFIVQLKHVSNGFWIGLKFPDTLIELANTQYAGSFTQGITKSIIFGVIVVFYIYVGFLAHKEKNNKEDKKVALLGLIVYIAIIVAALVISAILGSAILYHRYLITITGLLIFFLSYFMVKEKRKIITICICAVILVLSTVSNIKFIKENYDKSNFRQIEYLKENILDDDIIIYSNIIRPCSCSIFS